MQPAPFAVVVSNHGVVVSNHGIVVSKPRLLSIHWSAVFGIVLPTAAIAGIRNLIGRPFESCFRIAPDTDGGVAGSQGKHDSG